MITSAYTGLSIREQCRILDVNRSHFYYDPLPMTDATNLANEIYDIWIEWPQYGNRKITQDLRRKDYVVNHKRVLRIMQDMNIQAIYPRPKTSLHNSAHKIYPYLLKNVPIVQPNQVWGSDITYIMTPEGFMYLVALIDWFSRFIVAWNFSNTLETRSCTDMLAEALKVNKPNILNTDQGCQYTSDEWIQAVERNNIKVSMDGKGRWADNIPSERFWRTIKYEHILLHEFGSVQETRSSIGNYINKYNYKRLHQSLKYMTPAEVYFSQKMGGRIGS